MARASLGVRTQETLAHAFAISRGPQSAGHRWTEGISTIPLKRRFSDNRSPHRAYSMARAAAAEPFPTKFAEPVKSYDAHIYFFQDNPESLNSARALRETIIEKFPHLEVYKFWEKPIGPHPTGMFEVDMRTPAQFAEFIPWIQVHHGMHSVLIHPHTGDDFGDHTQRALWLGDRVPLITGILKGERPPA